MRTLSHTRTPKYMSASPIRVRYMLVPREIVEPLGTGWVEFKPGPSTARDRPGGGGGGVEGNLTVKD